MAVELHLHPERLLAHAITAADLSAQLASALRRDGPAVADPGSATERLRARAGSAVRELDELSALLTAAAGRARAADADLARAMGRWGGRA